MSSGEILAENLNYYMMRREMTQKALAKKCFVSINTLSRVLCGENSSLFTLEKIADCLGYEAWQLMKENGARDYAK